MLGQYNLVVSGVSDFWYLTTISQMLREAGQAGLDDQLVITPAGGALRIAYLGAMLQTQSLNLAVLLDSDPEGGSAHKMLLHHWMIEARHLLRLGEVLGAKEQRTLEDLFDEAYYMGHVNAAYRTELSGLPLTISSDKTCPVVGRIEDQFVHANRRESSDIAGDLFRRVGEGPTAAR